MPGGTGRCTETATVRGYSGNGGAKRRRGGTRPRLDAQAASEAITWVEEAQNIAVEEGHLKRVKLALPEATRRGDGAGGEERGAEPHLYILRDEARHGRARHGCLCVCRRHAGACSNLSAHATAASKPSRVQQATGNTALGASRNDACCSNH